MTKVWLFILSFCFGNHSVSAVPMPSSNFHFSRLFGKRLQCSVFKTFLGVNVMDCHEKCVSDMGCFSINFYSNINGIEVCELIKGTTSSLANPGCLILKDGSEYSELLNTDTCSSSASCKAGKIRKALPGRWYQLGSSAFKHFEQKKTYSEASAVCSANGGTLATINSDDENKFVTELYLKEQVSKKESLIKDKLKPYRRWKLDGSDENVTLHGSLVAKRDEYNSSAALHFTGTAGSYATTPAWGISTMTFSISIWIKMVTIDAEYYLYSYWGNPYIFSMGFRSSGALVFAARKKSNHYSDLFLNSEGQVVLNKWTHLVFVWNRDTKQATSYQDGLKVSQRTSSALEVDFPVPIRSVFDVGYKRDRNTVMKGWLRELLVFDRAVTTEEINIIRDATLLNPRIWIGPPQSYLNMAPVPQPNTNCFTARAWGTYQWEKTLCDSKLEFICKKMV